MSEDMVAAWCIDEFGDQLFAATRWTLRHQKPGWLGYPIAKTSWSQLD